MQTILRRLSLLLALLVALAGCAAAEAVPNPREEVADASAVEAALDISFGAPEGVEAVYTVIGGTTGEAAFTVGELECTLRAARTEDDISGLFMEMSEPTVEERALGEDAVSVSYRSTEENGGYGVYTWSVDDVQYCLTGAEILEGALTACAAAQ